MAPKTIMARATVHMRGLAAGEEAPVNLRRVYVRNALRSKWLVPVDLNVNLDELLAQFDNKKRAQAKP